MRTDEGGVAADPSYRCVGADGDGGTRWTIGGQRIGTADGAARGTDHDHDREQRARDLKRQTALEQWASASNDPAGGPNHSVLHRWLENRGIDVSRLPGGRVPGALAWSGACVDQWDASARAWSKAPAMVAKIVDAAGSPIGAIHRTFIDPGTAEKRAGHGEARRKLGSCTGGAVRLIDDRTAGVLYVGEGIETVLAAACALKGAGAFWAALDAPGLKALRTDGNDFLRGRAGTFHTVVVLADLDRRGRHAQNEGGAGVKAAEALAASLAKRYPWITVFVRFPSHEHFADHVEVVDGEQTPAGDLKSVDWNDVLTACGADAVSAAILDGVDLEASRSKTEGWRDGDRTTASDADIPEMRLIPDGSQDRAKMYLMEHAAPPEGERVGSRFHLAWWRNDFYQFDGAAYVKLDKVSLRQRIHAWLHRFYQQDRRGQIRPMAPTTRDAVEVMLTLEGLVAINAKSVPAWLLPTFDAKGEPLWGVEAEAPPRRGEDELARSYLVFNNLMLDAEAWGRGDCVWCEHHPCYFTLSALPHRFPIERVEQAEDDEAIDALVAEMCPGWLAFLGSACDDDDRWIACLQQWMGYSLLPSTIMEKLLVVEGPPRSGKGTIMTVWQRLLGEGLWCVTSFDLMTDKFTYQSWIGKLVAFMSDAEIGQKTDRGVAVEHLKARSAGDPAPIEKKGDNEIVSIVLPVRLVIFTNSLPSFRDSSGALPSRLITLRMKHSHLGKEDTSLKREKLPAEAEGIALWALQGLRQLQQRIRDGKGFTLPDSSIEHNREVMRSASRAKAFVEDECEVNLDARVEVDRVWEAWKTWCEEQGFKPGDKQSMGRNLRSALPHLRDERVRTSANSDRRTRQYVGLRLAQRAPEAQKDEGGDLPV